MIEQSDVKASGWSRVVDELSAPAPDDRVFFARLARVLTQVSAGRQAVIWAPDRTDDEGDGPEPKAVAFWPSPGAEHDLTSSIGGPTGSIDPEQIDAYDPARQAARSALGAGHARVFGLQGERSDLYYGAPSGQGGGGAAGGGNGSILAIPLLGPLEKGTPDEQPRTIAVATVLIEPRSRDALRSTMAMAEVLAGYVRHHAARAALRQTQRASVALDLASRLVASINNAPSFKGACLRLTHELADELQVERVSLGWARRDVIKLRAMSDTEHFDRRLAMVKSLESAMDECLDQEHAVSHPPPPAERDALLASAIAHAHRQLVSRDARARVWSVPMRAGEDTVGVLTVERTAEDDEASTLAPAADPSVIEMVQAACDLVTPVLEIRRREDRAPHVRAWDSTRKAASWAVGPTHTPWKIGGLLALAILLTLIFYRMPYRVGAQAAVQPSERRVVSSPFDGEVAALGISAETGERLQAGDYVEAGDELARLDTTELELSAEDARSQIAQAELEADSARREGNAAEARAAEVEADRARAQLALHEYRLSRAVITAPMGGVILSGDLERRLGSTVKLGEPLFEIAPTDDLLVIAKVDERDVALIERAMERGEGIGRFASKAEPDERLPLKIERLIPLARAVEGANVFEVRARLTEEADPMMAAKLAAGMEGLARFDTEEHSLMWILTRRIKDQIQLWVW